MKKPIEKAKERPAETAGGIGGAIAGLGAVFGLSDSTVAKIAVTAAFLPALVTYVVTLKRAAE